MRLREGGGRVIETVRERKKGERERGRDKKGREKLLAKNYANSFLKLPFYLLKNWPSGNFDEYE